MNPLDLIPPPWNLLAKIGLPILALVAAWTAGDLHGHGAENARLTAKYQPHLQHAADVMQLTAARIAAARAQALADDTQHARAVESAQTKAKEDHSDAIEQQLAAARVAAADYARRLRDQLASGQASGGGGGAPDRAGAAVPAGSADGAGRVPVMDDADLRICSENTVKALGWPAWWAEVSAIPR